MTDNEIIKALECCKSSVASCEECPMHVEGVICHGYELNRKALTLINRQQAEIERLQKYNTEVAYKHYNDGIKEFAEMLKKYIFCMEYRAKTKRKTVSIEKVKELIEWILTKVVIDTVDKTVKEMVGDTE